MKLYEVYLNRKIKYKDYILLIESGMFMESYNDDASLLNKILGYKILSKNSMIRVGFPSNNLSKVILILESKHINYLVLNKNNEIINRKKYKDNNYNNYSNNVSNLLDRSNRIAKIYNRLQSKIDDDNIDKIILKIEELL